jgi:DNA-binding response OmpR family regulator
MDARILLVDDSVALVEALTNVLSLQGYQVEARGNGRDGWERLMAGAEGQAPMPDLLLLDLMMPGVDGLTILRRMRADERFARLPVIILTVEDSPETRLRAFEAGANDYLAKPVQTVELLARVKALLNWQLAERLQQRRLAHLIEAGRVIMSTLDLDEVLQHTMQVVQTGLDTEGGTVWLLNPDGTIECLAASGSHADRLLGMRLETGQGVVGWIIQHRESVLVPNALADPRFSGEVDEQIGFRTRNLMGAPLIVEEETIGVVEAVNKRGGPVSPADLAWLQALAPLTAAAIEKARLYQELREYADRLEERVEERTAEVQAQ